MKELKILTIIFTLLMATLIETEVIAQSDNSSNLDLTNDNKLPGDFCRLRSGIIEIVNDTNEIVVITLYSPDNPTEPAAYWAMEPQQNLVLNTNTYNNFWIVQRDGGDRSSIGLVSDWNRDNGAYEIKVSRLRLGFGSKKNEYIVGTPNSCERRVEWILQGIDISEEIEPADLERSGNNLITQGNRQDGLIILGQAANLYRARNQMANYERVRRRMRRLGGSR